eukprot:3075888-Amphidinium_carterae.1
MVSVHETRLGESQQLQTNTRSELPIKTTPSKSKDNVVITTNTAIKIMGKTLIVARTSGYNSPLNE